MAEEREITGLLNELRGGNRGALEQLVPVLHAELHRIAYTRLRSERPGHTLQPTALIHETYLRLMKGAQPAWQNRAHFYALAARLMRQILTDYARARSAAKRGWDSNVTLEHASAISTRPPELLALDDALEDLARIDPRKSQVVELRYFAGLEQEEIAEVLAVSVTTVRRDLRMAEAWLQRQLSKSRPPP